MNLVSGELLWTNIYPIKMQYPYIHKNINTDVVVIGGGITGALCCHYLVEAGVDVALVEKNIIGYGSTSASTAIIQYEIDNDLINLNKIIGEENAVTAFKDCENAVKEVGNIVKMLDEQCGFSFRDCFYYTHKQSKVNEIQEEFVERKKQGFNVEYFDKDNCQNKFSFKSFAGIYSKASAAELNPYAFTQQVIKRAHNKGLKVYENTPILNIDTTGEKVTLTTKNNFKITANKVVVTTGYEGRKLVDKNIGKLSRTFTVVTKPVESFTGWHNRCIIRDNEKNYTYLRTTSDNRIIIGGEDIDVGGERSEASNLTNESNVSKIKYDILEQRLKQYFPNIKDIEIEYRFNGIFAETKDGLPYIGEYSKMPNVYFSLGYGANGIPYGVIGGQKIRDKILRKDSKEDMIYRIDR